MEMLKKISAMKARQNLGQIMNEVALRGDDYIIERAGKPLVAIINIEKYRRLQQDQESALQSVRKIWKKLEGANSREVSETIEEAIGAVRKVKVKSRA